MVDETATEPVRRGQTSASQIEKLSQHQPSLTAIGHSCQYVLACLAPSGRLILFGQALHEPASTCDVMIHEKILRPRATGHCLQED